MVLVELLRGWMLSGKLGVFNSIRMQAKDSHYMFIQWLEQ